MRTGLALLATDVVSALRALVERPAVDRAVAERAADIAHAVSAGGATAQVLRRGPGEYEVIAAAPGLFAREFGSAAAPPDPIIGPALDRIAKGAA